MVPTEGLSDCLKQKRVISRNIGEEQHGIYMNCKEVTASLYEDMGRLKLKNYRIVEIRADLDLLFIAGLLHSRWT